MIRRRLARVLALLFLLLAVAPGAAQDRHGPATPTPLGPPTPPELVTYQADWPAAQGNLRGTRAVARSQITTATVNRLEVAWSVPITATSPYGGMTATPLIAGDTIYIQDMQSTIVALDRATGQERWRRDYGVPSIGPNGLALGYGYLVGVLGDTAEVVALDPRTGEERWRARLSNNPGEGIDMAPAIYDSVVYASTVPISTSRFYEGGQRGVLHALDIATGATLWTFDTTDNLWGMPRLNSGGGLWYPPSVDGAGNLYFGTGNAGPWPGTGAYPNGSSRPGPNDYASSLVSLDPRTGAVRWAYNAAPHDLFDRDFQNTPAVVEIEVDGAPRAAVIGSGKTGTVVAADAATGTILWETAVGRHENDTLAAIPPGKTVTVWPGIFGGVLTPVAVAGDTVFVPVVNLPTAFTADGYDNAGIDFAEATGELVALDLHDGSLRWRAEIPTMVVAGATVAGDVVFTGGLDGIVRGYDTATGNLVWTAQAPAGLNAPFAVAGDVLLVPAAGAFLPGPSGPAAQAASPALVAFRLGG